ncbi:MAG: 5'-nucleotidase C-terminal domain-containing protein [Ectothiorhodospiraceae bacterium AqS1]|nr:5'-nucleotidase C-terminal domain-containing protein [Ectothiorhodospiraceae bacterium AqS1]
MNLKTGFIVSLVALALSIPSAHAKEVDITLLLISDIYRMESEDDRGGFSKAAAVARSERKTKDHLLYIHAGDTISPSLMSGIDKGAHVVELLNIVPPDLFVPGNHEFDFGPERFEELILEGLDSKILAANLRDGQGRPRAGIEDSRIYEFDGVKVGVYGLISPGAEFLSSPGPDYSFEPLVRTALATAEGLKEEGADIVVAVAHASFAEDERLMAEAGGAMDILLSGDDHDLRLKFDGRTVFAETRSDAEYMVAIDLAVEVEEKDGERDVDWWPNFRIIDTADYAVDPETEALAMSYQAQIAAEMDKPIGSAATPMDTRRVIVRTQESAFANLLTDAMRAFFETDIAITNGGGIRAGKEYPAGAELTRRDIFEELPFGNTMVGLRLSGATLLAALENGVSQVENGAGRFPHVSGMVMDVDPSKPPGERIVNVKVGGKALDENALYSVATNEYMARGGDGYDALAAGEVIFDGDDSDLIASILIGFIRANTPVSPKVEGRINLIKAN